MISFARNYDIFFKKYIILTKRYCKSNENFQLIEHPNLNLLNVLLTLFYFLKIVMERVVKRFLMQNQGESDDTKQTEFDELKQGVQMMRYEILNDMKKSREENLRNMRVINSGMEFVADEMINTKNPDSHEINKGTYKQFLSYKEILKINQQLFYENEKYLEPESPKTNYDDVFQLKRQSSTKSCSDSSEKTGEDTSSTDVLLQSKDIKETYVSNKNNNNKFSNISYNLHKIIEESEKSTDDVNSKNNCNNKSDIIN